MMPQRFTDGLFTQFATNTIPSANFLRIKHIMEKFNVPLITFIYPSRPWL